MAFPWASYRNRPHFNLHSHPGPRGRRRAPPRTSKHIGLWAFSLFGRAGAWRSRAGTMRCMLVLIPLRQATQQPPGSVPSAGARSIVQTTSSRARRSMRARRSSKTSAPRTSRGVHGRALPPPRATSTPPWKRTTSAVCATRRARRCAGSQPRSRRRHIPRPSSRDSPGVENSHRRRTKVYPRRSCTCPPPAPPRTLWRSCRPQTTKTQQTSTGWPMRAWRQGRWAGRSPNQGRAAARRGVGVARRRIRLWEKLPTSACPDPKRASRSAVPSPNLAPLPPHSRLRLRPPHLSRTACATPRCATRVWSSARSRSPAQKMTLTACRAGSTQTLVWRQRRKRSRRVPREALPSPGLSRGAGGFRFGGGAGKGMGGF
ncbi:hypothetical protein B0H14DRAFT_1498062 [Mycena olivaceomarginata]|nr:hypothetical protein B0H14DRAFT_1498062 [Mycena olivaceomarginata]